MKPSELLAVARLTRQNPGSLRYRFTTGGDGLGELSVPGPAWFYRPESEGKNLLEPALNGVSEKGEIFQLLVQQIQISAKGGWVELGMNPESQPVKPEDLPGCWICMPKSVLAEDSEGTYVFEMLGCEVKESPEGPVMGTVTGYFETSAHGILTIETLEGVDVLIPFIDQFVNAKIPDRILFIRQFKDFVI